MKFEMKIDSDNDAFKNKNELPRILRTLADKIKLSNTKIPTPIGGKLMDINGNSVGEWSLDYE